MPAITQLTPSYFLPTSIVLPNAPASIIARAARRNDAHFSDSFFSQCGIDCPSNIKRAVTKRRSEYFIGRYLAQMALSAAGATNTSISTNEDRCPIWPQSMCGSITHTDDFALCVVASTEAQSVLGVDAVDWMTDTQAERVTRKIVSAEETALINSSTLGYSKALSLCFSAKESIYKALFPYVRQFFGFSAARLLAIDNDIEALYFEITQTLPNNPLAGRELCVRYILEPNRGITWLAAPI